MTLTASPSIALAHEAAGDLNALRGVFDDLKAGFEDAGYDFAKLNPAPAARLLSPQFTDSFGRLQVLARGGVEHGRTRKNRWYAEAPPPPGAGARLRAGLHALHRCRRRCGEHPGVPGPRLAAAQAQNPRLCSGVQAPGTFTQNDEGKSYDLYVPQGAVALEGSVDTHETWTIDW